MMEAVSGGGGRLSCEVLSWTKSEDGQPSPIAAALGVSSLYNCVQVKFFLRQSMPLVDWNRRALDDQLIRLNGIVGWWGNAGDLRLADGQM